jgi:hypothetical protein
MFSEFFKVRCNRWITIPDTRSDQAQTVGELIWDYPSIFRTNCLKDCFSFGYMIMIWWFSKDWQQHRRPWFSPEKIISSIHQHMDFILLYLATADGVGKSAAGAPGLTQICSSPWPWPHRCRQWWTLAWTQVQGPKKFRMNHEQKKKKMF